MLMLFMAWSPTRRFNVGRFEDEHPGDYATFNSNQLRDGTLVDQEADFEDALVLRVCSRERRSTSEGQELLRLIKEEDHGRATRNDRSGR